MWIRSPVLDDSANDDPPGRRMGEQRNTSARELLARRVVAEFREMPGLRLTLDQAQRLFGLRSDICSRLIGTLVRDGVLRVDDEGRYATL